MEEWREIGEVDYDPFATTSAPAPIEAGPATPAPETQSQPAEPSTIPAPESYEIPAPETYKIPKITRAADKPKPAPDASAWKEIGEVDFDPFAEQPAAKEDVGFFGSIGAGFTGGKDAILGVGELARISQLPEEQQVAELLKIGTEPAPEDTPEMMEVTDVDSLGSAWEFVKQAGGQTIGSWGAAATFGGAPGAAAGAGIGAVAGAPVGGVGAGPGAVAGGVSGFGWGTLGAFGAMGVGGTFQDLVRDKGVQESLKNGTLTPNQLYGYATGAGAIVGAIDALPAGKAFDRISGGLGKEAVKRTFKSVALTALKGAAEEGSTEAVQQAISEGAQALAGGDIDGYERSMAVLNAFATGAVGGAGPGAAGAIVGPNTAKELPAKIDDVPDKAAPALPEGTPAAADPTVGASTPGGTSATTPPPPAGLDKQPPAAPPAGAVPTENDPAAEAKPPQPARATTVTTVAAVAPDLAAAQAGAPVSTSPVEAAIPAEEEFNLEEEVAEADVPAALDAQTRAIKDMFRDEAEAQRAEESQRQAQAIRTPVVTGGDPALGAAMAANAPPAINRPETLGTGIALTRSNPVQTPTAPPAVTPAAPAAPVVAAPPAPVLTEAPPPAVAAQPLQRPAAPAQPASPEIQAAPVPIPEDVAAFATTEPASLPPVQAAQPVQVAEQAAAPLPPKAARVLEVVKARRATGKPVEAPPAVEAVSVQPAAKPLPPKAAAAVAPKKSAVVKRDVIEAETKAKTGAVAEIYKPRSEEAKIAERERQAARKPLARDAQRAADDDLNRRSTVTELDDYKATLERISDEVAAQEPAGLKPAERIASAAKKIAARVEAELKEKQEAHDLEAQRLTERETKQGRRRQAGEAKVEKQAQAAVPQKKERAGKEKGKSETGILAESEKATLRAAEKAPDDKLLSAWMREYKARAEKRGEAREEHTQRMQQIQQGRAAIAAEKATAPRGPDEARQAVGETLKPAIAAIPQPKLTNNARQVQTAMVEDLRNVWAVTQGVVKAAGQQLQQKTSKVHNTPEENLAIYANQLMRQRTNIARKGGVTEDQYNGGHGATDFYMARQFYANGDFEQLGGLVTSDGLGEVKGTSAEVAARGGLRAAWSEAEDHDLTRRMTHQEGGAFAPAPDDDSVLERRRKSTNTAFHEIFSPSDVPVRRGAHTIEVTTPDGRIVTVKNARTKTGTAALNEALRLSRDNGGFVSILRNLHIKHLKRMVGDVDVHIVPYEAIQKLSDPSRAHLHAAEGLYYNYSETDRALGMRPMVFINEMTELDTDAYIHTLIHEMTHAATSQAMREGLHNSNKIFDAIRTALQKDLVAEYGEEQLREYGAWYAFKNNQEFVAEALSNPKFQELLAGRQMPVHLRYRVAGLTSGRRTTWWDAVVAAVSRAIGMISGQRGQSYMEQVLKTYPVFARSSEQQFNRAQENFFGRMQEQFVEPGSVAALETEFRSQVDGMAAGLGESFSAGKRSLGARFATTGELIRRINDITGDITNGLSKKAKLLLRKQTLTGEYRALSQALHLDLNKLKTSDRKAYRAMQSVLNEATRFSVAPHLALTDPRNKHIDKSGARHAQVRAKHAELKAEWDALSPEAKAIGERLIDYYDKMHAMETRAHVTHAVRSALRKYRQELPAGKSVDDIIEWVMSGDAARVGEQRTSVDQALHAALGKTGETIASVPKSRKMKGVYVPLTRRGKYFFTATEKVEAPPGGIVVDGNKVLFKDKQKFQDFVENSPLQVRTGSMWIDPKTGEKVKGGHLETWTKKVFVATVQNKRMEMSDSQRELRARRKEVEGAGAEVSAILESGDFSGAAGEAISSPQLQRLLNNAAQTAGGEGTGTHKLVTNAVVDMWVRQMTAPSHLNRHLKRRNVLGFNEDIADALGDYSAGVSHHLANMELEPQIAEANAEFAAYMKGRRRDYGTEQKTQRLQTMEKEIAARFDNPYDRGAKTKTSRAADVLMNLTFLRHLASPHYTITNSLQPMMTTYPILAARFGDGATNREMIRAARIGGVFRTLGVGFRESWAHARTLVPYSDPHASDAELAGMGTHDQRWYNMMGAEPDGRQLQEAAREMTELGFGAGSGLEYGTLDESNVTAAEKYLVRATNVARALPEAAEANNRYTTLIAAYRLAVRSGMDHAHAKDYAVLAVEQTQGGYARANNPVFASNPLLRWPLQFKKYGLMYGQAYYGALYTSLNFKEDPATRKIAAKQLLRLSLTTAVFAGIGGQAFMEIARMFANVAFMIGLTDMDWEDDEKALQEWFGHMAEVVTGSKEIGDKIAEVGMHGLTRLAAVDTSSNLGAENLVTFGSPRSMDEKGFYEWMGRTILGAPGKLVVETAKAIHEGDYTGVFPWPKFVENFRKSYGEYAEGTVNPKTGEKYADPVGLAEAGWRALGFTPASVARQWESGGSGAAAKEERAENRARSELMGRWANADPAGKRRIFATEVKEWNKAHPKERISYSNLVASQKSRARRKKEIKERMEE